MLKTEKQGICINFRTHARISELLHRDRLKKSEEHANLGISQESPRKRNFQYHNNGEERSRSKKSHLYIRRAIRFARRIHPRTTKRGTYE